MNRFPFIRAAIVFILVATLMLAAQSVYPTGTTIYDPDKTWNGYTVLSPLRTEAVIVIDMNGNVVKRWEGFNNSAGGPARIFPDGVVMSAGGSRPGTPPALSLDDRGDRQAPRKPSAGAGSIRTNDCVPAKH